jgi:hypothetical protein
MMQDYAIAGNVPPISATFKHKSLHPKTVTVFLDAGLSGKTSAPEPTPPFWANTFRAYDATQGRPDAFPRLQWNVATKFPRAGAESRHR